MQKYLMFFVPRSIIVRPTELSLGQPPKLKNRDEEQNESPTSEGKRSVSCYLNTSKPMESEGIHPRVLRELVQVLTEPLFHQQSWLTEVPADFRSANVMSNSRKCWKKDLSKHKPFSLNSCQERSWSSSSCVQLQST